MSILTDKLDQVVTIQAAMKAALLKKDGVSFAEADTFADWPAKIAAIPGHLEDGTAIPTAAGGEVLPSDGYDGFRKVVLPAEPNLVPESIAAGKSIYGVSGTVEAPEFSLASLFDGTLTDVKSTGASSLRGYAFYQNSALKTAEFPACRTVGSRAFDSCGGLQAARLAVLETLGSYAMNNCASLTEITGKPKTIGDYALQNCGNLATLDLSLLETLGSYGLYNCRKLSNIGAMTLPLVNNYACCYLAYNDGTGFAYKPNGAATVKDYGFQYAKITEATGEFAYIGPYAFENCQYLEKLHLKVNGPIYDCAFRYSYKVADFDIDPASKLTILNQYAFFGMGGSRATPESNRLCFDLRNSSFSTIGSYAFAGGSSATQKLRYADILLPESVTTVSNYAFQYLDNATVRFTGAVPPTLSGTYCFSSATNYKLLVPYQHAKAYQTATNWVALAANMLGVAEAGTFAAGETLPAQNAEGYALTWYADTEKTEAITTATGGALYCVAADRTAWIVRVMADADSPLVFTDSEGDTYQADAVLVPIGRSLTISLTHEGWNNRTMVDGTEVTLPYTFAVSKDVTVKSNSWQGDIETDFATAGWAGIKKAVLAGVAGAYYAVGATKTVTLKNGTSYTLRVANNSGELYELADGSGSTGFVMEFVELWADKTVQMNPTATNVGGWDASSMRTSFVPEVLAQLPDDLAAVIATVKTKSCKSGTDPALNTSADTLFLPAERELFANRSYSRQEEWNALTRWQYYANNDSSAARVKKRNSTADWWWERGPRAGDSDGFCGVSAGGDPAWWYAGYQGGAALCFCI